MKRNDTAERNNTAEMALSILLAGCIIAGLIFTLIVCFSVHCYIEMPVEVACEHSVHYYIEMPVEVACEHYDYLTNTSDSVNIDYITNFKASPPEDCCGKRPKEICVFEYTAQSFNPVGVIENFLGDIEYYEIKGKPRGEKVKIQ